VSASVGVSVSVSASVSVKCAEDESKNLHFLRAGWGVSLSPAESGSMFVYLVRLPGQMFAQVVRRAQQMFAP
jgi:hypothetical protein